VIFLEGVYSLMVGPTFNLLLKGSAQEASSTQGVGAPRIRSVLGR